MGKPGVTGDGKGLFKVIPMEGNVVLPFSVESLSSPLGDGVVPGTNVVAVALKNAGKGLSTGNVLPIGVVAAVLGKNYGKVVVKGERRVRIKNTVYSAPYVMAEVTEIKQKDRIGRKVRRLMKEFFRLAGALVARDKDIPGEIMDILKQHESDPISLPDIAATTLGLGAEPKKMLLLETGPEKRFEILNSTLSEMIEASSRRESISRKALERMEKARKEAWLREQLAVIREELGEKEGSEADEYRKRIQEKGLPDYAVNEAERELRRLAKLPPASSEAGVIRSWLDFLVSLPWRENKASPPEYSKVMTILDKHHHGLAQVKERIAEEIAVMRISGPRKGGILCFAGPPGTGKTSLGIAVAEALGRPYYRIAVGGMRDESEIRGHRRTYVGAMPGRILEGLRRVEAKDPVFLIDEVDKMGSSVHGDPAAALLEVLDPEQNHSFIDHYLGIPFDLSNVVFVATANVAESIPFPLRDRMEVIQLSGYTEEEKVEIATRFLLPRSLVSCGLPGNAARVTKKAVQNIIRHYTREAGVRNLNRVMEKITRKVAVLKMGDQDKKLSITVKDIGKLLGPPRFRKGGDRPDQGIGIALGLAWTPSGGEILEVEAIVVPGHGKEVMTGYLGQVMRESVHTALTIVRARARKLGIRREVLERGDIHIHFPAGAIPKDGPSAGIAVAIAAASALSGRRPKPGFAMTGEVTLRGRVLPVGGLREKVLAASRCGIQNIIIPKANVPDLKNVPDSALEGLNVYPVRWVDEAFEYLLPFNSLAGKRK